MRVGDGMEYYAMLFNLAEFHQPFSTPESWDFYDKYAAERRRMGFIPYEKFLKIYHNLYWPYLAGADFPHFWFYSFLVVPFYYVTKLLHIDAAYGFTFFHLFLVFLGAKIAEKELGPKAALTFILFIIFTPALWYVNKAHTEFLTIVLTTIAAIFLWKEKYLYAATSFSILATQNLPFAIIGFLVVVYWFFAKRNEFLKKGNLILLLINFLLVLIHPLYYYLRINAFDPLLLGAVTKEFPTLKKMLALLIDPDISLLPNWPLGIAIIALLVWLVFAGTFRKINIRLTLFIFTYIIIVSMSQSQTISFNSGAAVSVQRYCLWYLFLFYPAMYYILSRLELESFKYKVLVLGLCFILGVISIKKFSPSNNEEYFNPTFFSSFLYKYIPGFYDPIPEIFIERHSGVRREFGGAGAWAYSNPTCNKIVIIAHEMRKVNVRNISKPAGCARRFDGKKLYSIAQELAGNRSELKDFFINLSIKDVENYYTYPVLSPAR